MSRPSALPASPLLRFTAAACALLVFALTLLAASPEAHGWLHATDHASSCPAHAKHAPAPAPEADACAVVLLASTVDIPVEPLALTPPQLVAGGVSPVTAADFYLVSPRYLRQPERGPPSSRIS